MAPSISIVDSGTSACCTVSISVSGTVRYGRIEVIAGGELSGEISKVIAEEEASKPAASAEASPVAVADTAEATPDDNVDIAAEGD